MTLKPLNNINKSATDNKPFYLRVKLNPLNAYRLILFIAIIFVVSTTQTTAGEIFRNAAGSAAIVIIATTISLWTKAKKSFAHSAAMAGLFIVNAIIILSLSLFIFKKV